MSSKRFSYIYMGIWRGIFAAILVIILVCLDALVYSAIPAPPTRLKIISGNSAICLFWAPNTEPDIYGYNIYRSDSEIKPPVKIGAVWYKTRYRDINVVNGKTYYYRLRAFNQSQQESDFSAPILAETYKISVVAKNWERKQ